MGQPSRRAFDEGGILISNAQACKAGSSSIRWCSRTSTNFVRRDDPDFAKRLFYVHGRASQGTMFMFMKRGEGRDIEKILPPDQDVLRRKEL